MTEHSNIMGGSTATRRIHCPGSYQREEKVGDTRDSWYADEGSMLHACMELLLLADVKNIKEAQPLLTEMIGQDMGYKGHEVTADHVVDKIEPALNAWWRVDEKYEIVDIFIEQRVSLEAEIDGAFGTADIIGLDASGRLHVLDWKFGDGVPVPVESNLGAGFYAAATLYDPDKELADFRQNLPPTEELEVVLHIVQPRRGHSDDPLQTWETTGAWVETVVDSAFAAAELMHKDDAPLKPGDWCHFCRGKPMCEAHQQLASQAVSAKLPGDMSETELADYLHKADLLVGWCKDIYAFAQHQLENGVAIPGYKLVNKKKGPRKFKDKDAAEALCKKSRLKIDEMYDKKLKSPTQLEKIAPNVYSKKLAPLVVSESSGVTIVPDTDPRPAVVSNMALLANEMGKLETTDKQETEK